MMHKRIVAAALGAAILAIPAAAVADSGHGKRPDKQPAAPKVTFVFKGIFTAPGTLEVRSGNAHVRKGGFVGQKLNFDLTTARVVAADSNADQKVDVSDVNSGRRRAHPSASAQGHEVRRARRGRDRRGGRREQADRQDESAGRRRVAGASGAHMERAA